MKTVFPASGNRFFNECFIPVSGNGFFSSVFLFRANFALVETIIQIKVKLFFIE